MHIAPCLNLIGLVLNIAGVVLLFFYGFPQPSFEEGIGIDLEDANALPSGETVGERRGRVRAAKSHYASLSRLSLGLIVLGFVCQCIAALAPIISSA